MEAKKNLINLTQEKIGHNKVFLVGGKFKL